MTAAARSDKSASSENEAMARLVAPLRQQFPEVDIEQIERAMQGRDAEYDGRPVRDFVPILVERAAHHDLRSRTRRVG